MTGAQRKDGPFSRLEGGTAWRDAVLDRHVREQVEEIIRWAEHGDELTDFRLLFEGAKLHAMESVAAAIAAVRGWEPYRIDLSSLADWDDEDFNRAEALMATGRLILLTAADKLFSHDKETRIAALRQKIEETPAVIIATNLRSRLDDAFQRRFEKIIRFEA